MGPVGFFKAAYSEAIRELTSKLGREIVDPVVFVVKPKPCSSIVCDIKDHPNSVVIARNKLKVILNVMLKAEAILWLNRRCEGAANLLLDPAPEDAPFPFVVSVGDNITIQYTP